jgi:uncharacterized membrane protein
MATEQDNKNITQVIYALYAAGFVTGGLTSIAAVIMNYVKRPEVAGSMYEGHFTWQIRTFWFSLLFSCIGWITTLILIGFLILLATVIWVIYRIVIGWMRLSEGKPIEKPEAFI